MKKYIVSAILLMPYALHSANTVDHIRRLISFLNNFREMHANPLVVQGVVNNQPVEIRGTDVLRTVYDENINRHQGIPEEMQALDTTVHRQNATPEEIFTETQRAIQTLRSKLQE